MPHLEAVEGLETLPRRIFLEGDRRPETDSDGFVRPSGESLCVEDLLVCAAVLAAAPPWTGKSFVAKQLEASLRRGTGDGTFCSPEFVERTCFEEPAARLAPLWWDQWKNGDQKACWIVDAIDEDARRGREQIHHILELIGELQESSRARLCSIFFVRISEIPKAFDDKIGQLFGERLKRVRLAGLDREAAKNLVGAEQFVRVCTLLRENDLREVAALPPVLLHLLDLKGEVARGRLNQEAVWRGILKDLLREQPHRHRSSASEVEIEDRFKVAQRLAAIVTFCGHQEICDPPRSGILDLEEALPAADGQFRILRQAGREVMKSAVFERSNNGFRFSQDHVREWFAAFALQGMHLAALRPLLVDDSGQPSHRELMRVLALISPVAEVRAWVLEIAACELDQLQEIARKSPRGLDLWYWDRLTGFKIAGMGAEIARRLEQDLHPVEQQFLLDLALVIDVPEPLSPAARILQDDHRDERVRESAAGLVAALGTTEDLAPLASWIEALQEVPGKAILQTLEVAFYWKGLWSFEKAAERALSGRILHNSWLQSCLAGDLTLDRARWLIRQSLLPTAEFPLPYLVTRALRKVQEQEIPEEMDVELLFPFLLADTNPEESERARKFLERSPASRRKLFLDGMAQDPQCLGENRWVWRDILNGEDAGWLLDLFRTRRDRPEWLSGRLYFLAYSQGVSPTLRYRVRQTLRRADAQTLKVLDEDRKDWTAHSQKRRQKWRRQEKRAKAQIYQLGPLVRKTLDSEKIELRHRMLQLSWYCFEPPSQRPSNLSGQWENLPANLRDEVITVCREALVQCPPTDIPLSASYSRWTSWEAACFHHLVSEEAAFVLTSEMIQKWFPALLRSWVTGSGFEPTLRRCFEVDRNLAEGLLCQEIRRSALTEKGTYILQYLPPELWSERLASLLEAIVADPQVKPETRIDLLERIARIFPLWARSIASAWAQGTDMPLRDAGIDLLLMVAPEEGWRHLKALAEREEPGDILRRMRSLFPHHYGLSAVFSSWPAVQLAELVELLLQIFPPDNEPQRETEDAGDLVGEDDLCFVRDDLPQLLYRRDQEGDHAVLETLADRHRHIREWLDIVRAHQGAESVIASLGRSTRPPGEGKRVPLPLMLKLLQESQYRVLGSADDLLEVILEQLRLIAAEAKQHLSLLYHPRPRAKGQKRGRLQEDALQAYLACRLTDRLPLVTAGQGVKVIFVNRETLAARDTRNDLKIQATSYEGRPLTVILEVKWSDNNEVSTSLVHQLGEDYLLQNNHTHGIYLVGWSGDTKPWKSTVGPAPVPRESREAWRKALADQAELFCQAHAGLRITPLVMDLAWD